jgi:Fe-S-cluster containining protein
MSDALVPVDVPNGIAGTGQRVSCDACAAVCCRLEVLLVTETGVPRRYRRPNPGGVDSMHRLDDGWCAALDRDTLLCSIYAQRPLICREFATGGPDCLAERAACAAA